MRDGIQHPDDGAGDVADRAALDALFSDAYEELRRLAAAVSRHDPSATLSPTTARYDRFTKRRLYQEMRVPLYWLIDIDQRRAEVWTPEATFPVIETQSLTWQPAGTSEAFILELATLLQG